MVGYVRQIALRSGVTGVTSPVSYELSLLSPDEHLFQVRVSINEGFDRSRVVEMVAWTPGSYMVRDFARNLIDIRASSGGDDVELEKLDKQTWSLPACSAPVVISYSIYAWDASVRAAYLDRYRAYINGSSLFLRVCGFETQPLTLELLTPKSEELACWRVVTTLPTETPYQFGVYRASDYDDLVDHPIEMGDLDVHVFSVGGVEHALSLSGLYWMDHTRVLDDLRVICAEHVALFGGELPVDRYLFLTWVVGDGYGGLEHRDSASLQVSRHDLAESLIDPTKDGYIRFLGLCSHEYFHLWNVKRIRPRELSLSRQRRETYTELLWLSEGVTSYYDDLALVRSKRISLSCYLGLLAKTITRVHRGSSRFRQSLAESSFYAWTKFYKQDSNAPNSVVSYYAKGALVALMIDDHIRLASGEAASLDDFMRLLWAEYGHDARGVTEADIKRILLFVGFRDVDGFFCSYIHGRAELPLADLLLRYGIVLSWRIQTDSRDFGGEETSSPGPAPPVEIGGIVRDSPAGLEVVQVYAGGTLQGSGVAPGDVIVAMAGLKASETLLSDLLRIHRPGDVISVHLFRRDELVALDMTVLPATADTCVLAPLDEDLLTKEQYRRREAWLASAGSQNGR